MDLPIPESDLRPVTLAHALNHCRHGHEVRDLTTEETFGAWVIWGRYACPECGHVALDATTFEPHEATIAGKRLKISRR
jgi:hypothetical protein